MNNCSSRRCGEVNPRRHLSQCSSGMGCRNARQNFDGYDNCHETNTSCGQSSRQGDNCTCAANSRQGNSYSYPNSRQSGGCGCELECKGIDTSLAMVYPVAQQFVCVYDTDSALMHGTAFKELYKPFEGESVVGCKR